MAETKPVQPFADRTAMHLEAVNRGQFGDDLVQSKVALDRKPVLQPATVRGQLALAVVALRLGRKPAAFALQDHPVVPETRRNPKMPSGLTMTVPLFNKGDHPAPQLDRMWLAHSQSPNLVR